MRRVLLMAALALAGSQAGHLIAYAVRFGAAAGHVQSSGAHAYFPVAAKTALGLVAAALLVALLLIALARSVSSPRRVATGPSFMSLLAILFTVQLVCFVVQEIVETAIAGMPAESVAGLALWGMFGQLPAAVVVAATLRWLWSRVESAVLELRSTFAVVRWTVAPAAPAWQPVYVPVARSDAWRSHQNRRGPPHSS